ncbi:MAG: hypothetical protein K1Y36_07905 [Blastocatellia bacterium]|nr:hypothetical protein [Blastocatellia bacterium]
MVVSLLSRIRSIGHWALIGGMSLLVAGSVGATGPGLSKRVRQDGLPILPFSSLTAFVANVKANLPRANTEGFVKPSTTDRAVFQNVMTALLQRDYQMAQNLAATVNYDIARLEDQAATKTYVVAVERQTGFRGLGTYIVDPKFERNVILEVPHPLFDSQTPEEGTKIFQGIGAQGLFISGTHRCANSETSPCSGTTTVCDGVDAPFRISDVGHSVETFFQPAHAATLALNPPPLAISLHGNGQTSLPDFTLSDGTTKVADETALVNRLRKMLLKRRALVGSCNSADDSGLSLCGTTNVQGRLSNGVAAPCNTSATTASGLFLHVEQHLNVRNDPRILIAVLLKTIPVTIHS